MSDSSAHLHMFLSIRRELVGYAAKITGDRIQAEDIVQEAWIRFSPAKAQTRPAVEQPVAYLYRIVRNLALDLKRSRSREHDHAASPPLWLLPTTANDPAEICQHSMTLERLSDALQALPDNSRKALELHRFGGFTLAEIAGQLGVSLTTAHRLLREALLALARVMDHQDDGKGANLE
ncbi:sigma-70 family RNA polymerase sigma factor [Pseudomonas sp. TMW22090]|jgi:RNA polymerase sigma factor (sigma-70 family)|uniref:RNA polymerase sigma factor n=1 Tax=Pseudomonas sp. TMW22090 TaxID=2506434 RepID=UPI001F0FBD94|nr:sigma-70 family RNA polymerase sigma factor [Pseudomonas sp. TMW22090]MCH4875876.1 sigma-70 family RNA polymerase sigma factor [Pseudomonas sp. TMW22090]